MLTVCVAVVCEIVKFVAPKNANIVGVSFKAFNVPEVGPEIVAALGKVIVWFLIEAVPLLLAPSVIEELPNAFTVPIFVLNKVNVVLMLLKIVEASKVRVPLFVDVPRAMLAAPAVPPVPMLIVLA